MLFFNFFGRRKASAEDAVGHTFCTRLQNVVVILERPSRKENLGKTTKNLRKSQEQLAKANKKPDRSLIAA